MKVFTANRWSPSKFEVPNDHSESVISDEIEMSRQPRRRFAAVSTLVGPLAAMVAVPLARPTATPGDSRPEPEFDDAPSNLLGIIGVVRGAAGPR